MDPGFELLEFLFGCLLDSDYDVDFAQYIQKKREFPLSPETFMIKDKVRSRKKGLWVLCSVAADPSGQLSNGHSVCNYYPISFEFDFCRSKIGNGNQGVIEN
jgi:hypothetical protein